MNTTDTAPSKLAKVLEQVRHLLAKAESTNHEAEAEMCRTRAEALMFKYRIDIATAQEQEQQGLVPSWRNIDLVPMGSDFEDFYRGLAGAALRHVDCHGGTRINFETGMVVLEAVGYESDLAFADLLITSVQAAFARHLEPQFDPSETPEANAYRLRSGGWTRAKIGTALFGHSDTVNEMKAKNRKVTALIKSAGAANGEGSDHLLGRNVNIETYRASFAQGFYGTLVARLGRMAQLRGEEGALVFAGRKEAVMEAFYEKYPSRRPGYFKDTTTVKYVSRENCDKCQKASSGYCREHNFLRPKKATGPAVNWTAYEKGEQAARTVDVGTVKPRLAQ